MGEEIPPQARDQNFKGIDSKKTDSQNLQAGCSAMNYDLIDWPDPTR